jgi:hypothetical protein
MQSMLWLEEADHAFARRGEEGWEKIGRVVTFNLPSYCLYDERRKIFPKHTLLVPEFFETS